MPITKNSSDSLLLEMWNMFVERKYEECTNIWKKYENLTKGANSKQQLPTELQTNGDFIRQWKKARILNDSTLILLGHPSNDIAWQKTLIENYWFKFAEHAAGEEVDVDLGSKMYDPELAIFFYDRALLFYPKTLIYLLKKGKILEKIGNIAAAKKCYSEITFPFLDLAITLIISILLVFIIRLTPIIFPFDSIQLIGTILTGIWFLSLGRLLFICWNILRAIKARKRIK